MPLRVSVDYMTDSGARSLAAAVCLQAIKDYDRLCDMLARGKIREDDRGNLVPGPTFHRSHYIGKKRYGKTLSNYSFAEIERFFLTNSELWTDTPSEISVNFLLKRKRDAMRRARRK